MNTDPLGFDDFDPNEVDTSRPLLPAGDVQMQVKAISVVDSKNNATNKNLMVVFATTEPVHTPDDKVINPGFQLTKYYPLQQSSNEKAPDYRVDLTRLIDGVLGTSAGARPRLSDAIPLMIGRNVMVSVTVRKPKPGSSEEQYGDSNEIKKISPIS